MECGKEASKSEPRSRCSETASLTQTWHAGRFMGKRHTILCLVETFHGNEDEEEVQCVMWETVTNPDGWKDFVELAKSAAAPFLTMHSWKLEREELDELVERLAHSEFSDGDDVEDARWLRAHVGKVGFLQLGWAYQGSMFLCEVSTDWYERYQRLLEMSEDFGGIPIDEPDQDDEN